MKFTIYMDSSFCTRIYLNFVFVIFFLKTVTSWLSNKILFNDLKLSGDCQVDILWGIMFNVGNYMKFLLHAFSIFTRRTKSNGL